MAEVRPPASRKPSSSEIAAAVGAAVLVIAPITAAQEGYVRKASPDPAGYSTFCFGERVNLARGDPSRIYSRDECMARLRARMATSYAPQVLKCLPELVDRSRRNVFAALIDAAWNAGPGAVCSSPMAAKIRAGRWTAACDSFVGWRVTARGVTYRGLVRRRRDVERPLCLVPVPAPNPRPPSPIRADYQRCVTVRLGPVKPPTKPALYRNNSELS